METGDKEGEASSYGNLGTVFKSLGQYDKAKEYLEKALAITKQTGDKRGEEAVYRNLGAIFLSLGQYDKAQEYLEKALAITIQIGDKRGEEAVYRNLGTVFKSLGQYYKAKEYLEKALAITIQIGDKEEEAAVYRNLGAIFLSFGQCDKAQEYLEKALAITIQIGEKRGEEAVYRNLGTVFKSLGQYDKAKECLERALAITIQTGDKEEEEAVYRNLGAVFLLLGQYDKAEEYLEKALAIEIQIGDKVGEASSYRNLGTVVYSLGQYNRAKEYLEKALAIEIQIGDKEGEASSYVNLGTVFQSLDQYDKAKEYLEKALAIKIQTGDKEGEASSYVNLATVFKSLGQYDKAKHYLERALAITKRIGDKPGEEAVYRNLGAVFLSLGQYDKAEEYREEALAIEIQISDKEGEASSYGNLGTVFKSLGQCDEGKEYLEKPLAIKIQSGDKEGEASLYGNLRTVIKSLGQYDKAEEYLEKAPAITMQTCDKAGEASWYGNLGTVFKSLFKYDKAKEYLEKTWAFRMHIGDKEAVAAHYGHLGTVFQFLFGYDKANEYLLKALTISIPSRARKGEVADYGNVGNVFQSPASELRKIFTMKTPEFNENQSKAKAIMIYEGKVLLARDMQIICPNDEEIIPGYTRQSEDNPASFGIVPYEEPSAAKVIEIVQKPSTTAERKLSENESRKDSMMTTPTLNKNQSKVEGVVNHEGGVLFAEDVQVIFPNGAISKLEDDVVLKIVLENPSTHCDMIVKNGLENEVMFIAPVINLQPNGQVFKKPVTLQVKLTTETDALHPRDVLVLHGTQAPDGKIVWEDITDQSTLDLDKRELNVQIFGFSRIATLLRLTSIFAKDVINRLNLLGFYYTMSVLFKKNHPHSPLGELALVFMSHDVFHETSYREHPSSVLMQLERNEYQKLCTIDRPESNRIYNNETLKVSLLLGQDYEPTHGQLESNVEVDSSVWWSTGHVLQWSLKGTDGVRILCGEIRIEGQHGHILRETFCELDTYEYVRKLLKVWGGILNLVPFARELGVEKEEVIKEWQNDEKQLKIILQHWLKRGEEECCMDDPSILRKTIQGLNSEEFEVDERGKMHINHLRELAINVESLNRDDPHLMEYFSNEITTLCNSILKDCCIELDAEVSVGNYPRFLFLHQQVTDDVALKLETICSSSTKSTKEDFFSIAHFLVQAIKEIFHKEKNQSVVQNGLRGLPKETVSQFESNVRDAFLKKDILKLLYEVCGVLASLCLNNCKRHSTEEIDDWCESLAIWHMCEFLKEFFQSRQDSKLHKRLKLLSRSLRRITQDVGKIKEIELCYFYNVSLNLIKFATFNPSKLVRFEITGSTNPPVTHFSEDIKYDSLHDMYSQQFEFRKESEDELRLGAIARVYLDRKIHDVGAFESVFVLPTSKEKLLNRLMFSLPVAVKLERADSGDFRVVLSSTRRKNISEALRVLQRELGEDIVDGAQIDITESHLRLCCSDEAVGTARLRLQYKWRAEAISVDSKDFSAIGESSSDASDSVSSVANSSSPPEAELAIPSVARHLGGNLENFVMDPSEIEILQTHASQNCGRVELHLHKTIMKGHVCVAGNSTNLRMEMPAQSFLQAGLPAPSQQSITAGASSDGGEVSEPQTNQ